MKDTHFRDWLVEAIEDSGYPPEIKSFYDYSPYEVIEFYLGADGVPQILVRQKLPKDQCGPAHPDEIARAANS